MTDAAEVAEAEEASYPSIVVHLGNRRPQGDVAGPSVTTTYIPQGPARNGGTLYSFPEEHEDGMFADHPSTAHIAAALSEIPDASKAAVRRALIDGQFAHPSGVKGLPNHEAATLLLHPAGVWTNHAMPGSVPEFVSSNHKGYEKFLADYFGCAAGMPDDVEDRYWTRHGSSIYCPGAIPDPLAGVTMMHSTYGVANQALLMGGNTAYSGFGTTGTATAATGTTLAGSAESGGTHALNDMAGQWLVVSANASGTGSKVFGLILSNTTGTTPTYTVDQWYNAQNPGGAVGTTPNATSFYQVLFGGPPAPYVALSSNTVVPSYGGTGGTQDAATLAQTLTGEFTTGSSGLLRKVGAVTFTAGSFLWTNTITFTATATDQGLGAQTVAKAVLTPSIVINGGACTYMTLVSPTATLTATGDALTLTWQFTETHS